MQTQCLRTLISLANPEALPAFEEFEKQLALELGPHGVTVNSVAPGFVRSNPASEAQWQAYGAEGQARLLEATFLRRLGTVEDIADAVLWLASDASGWVTGQVLSVDGGRA